MLSNFNGTLSTSTSPSKLGMSISPPASLSPSKAFLNLDTPAQKGDRRVTIAVPSPIHKPAINSNTTPSKNDRTTSSKSGLDVFDLDSSIDPSTVPLPETPARPETLTGGANSPATPYFLHPTEIVQKTCPPKQAQETLFPLSGRIQDQPDESLRQRLMDVRRKSLQFAPKVKSPLSKGFPFND